MAGNFLITVFHLILLGNSVFAEDDCDPYYDIGFADTVSSCSNFDNKVFKCDELKLIPMTGETDDDPGYMCLSGPLIINQDIKDGTSVKLEIMKETDIASEIMWSSTVDLCKSMDSEDAPWKPVFEAMQVYECPISAGEYPIEKLKLSLDFAQDVLSHEYVGEYKILTSVVNNADELSCHEFAVVIYEKNDKC